MDADYDGFHDNDEGEEDDNDENWVYLYNANFSWSLSGKRRQKWKKLLGLGWAAISNFDVFVKAESMKMKKNHPAFRPSGVILSRQVFCRVAKT